MVIMVFIIESKNDELDDVKKSIERVFFFLPDKEYDNMNNMSDYCKLILIFNSDYLKNDILLSKDDYTTIVKRDGVKGYKTSNIINSLKTILGNEATINFDSDEYGDYEFLIEDDCKIGNKFIGNLSYNESSNYVYSYDSSWDYDNYKLNVKWDEPKYSNNQVFLTAKALITVKRNDGKYDVFVDSNFKHNVGFINNYFEINKFYIYSNTYKFTLQKDNDKYIWTRFEVDDSLYNGTFVD